MEQAKAEHYLQTELLIAHTLLSSVREGLDGTLFDEVPMRDLLDSLIAGIQIAGLKTKNAMSQGKSCVRR